MPELPDVELYKRRLDRHGLKHRIAKVTVSDERILAGLPVARLSKALEGQRFETSRRHGKHLLARLDRNGWVTFHFGMTGDLVAYDTDGEEPRYTRVRLDFADGGHLAYVNRRMLGHVGLTEDAETFIADEKLGPDALDPDLDERTFLAALGSSRRTLKAALMDQSAVAGIGNIFADEILFQARLHPETKLGALSDAERKRLFEATRTVLQAAIEHGAGSEQFEERLPAGFIIPQRRKGGRCPRCGTAIESFKAGGRTAYLCPNCQKPKS
ncbi:MAG: DNA-formamidopyrimidine glycosylase [Kiloniellales bacterium]